MKALHFGAGNIGRGFIGKLLADAGIELTFADVNQTVLDALNARHSYQVHVVGENEQVDTVSGVNAVSSIGDEVSWIPPRWCWPLARPDAAGSIPLP